MRNLTQCVNEEIVVNQDETTKLSILELKDDDVWIENNAQKNTSIRFGNDNRAIPKKRFPRLETLLPTIKQEVQSS